MKYFQNLLKELKVVADNHRVGDVMTPPPSLAHTKVLGKRMSFLKMGLNRPGPAIILIHGFGGFFMDWPRIMVPLSKKFRLFAPDLPGWGFSESPEKITGLTDHGEALREFIIDQNLDEVILVGLSYGAAVAWCMGTQKIPQVKKLILLNPMPPYPLRYMHSHLYRAIFMLNHSAMVGLIGHKMLTKLGFKLICKENLKNRKLLDTFYLHLGFLLIKQPHVSGTLHLFSKFAQQIDWDYWETKVSEIDLPVTIMQGLNDRVFSIESAEYLQNLIPNSKLIGVPDCGHAMVFDQHRHVSRYIWNHC